jgi:5-methylcytosine-specific restriction endonuclease McrA
MKYDRHSAAVLRSKRWKSVRYQAKQRDGWQCVQCCAKGRLEVDHIQPVRTHPERAYDLTNLQTLCVSCHSRKTRIEIGLGVENPKRDAWKELVRELHRNPQATEKTHA